MAYAFDSIMDAMNGDDEGSSSQSNITDGGQGSVTSEAGSGGVSGGGSASPGQTSSQQNSTGASNRIMSQNRDKAVAPVDVNRISDSVGQAKTNLQNEANSYIQGADDDYEAARGTVANDVRGYADNANPKGDWLNLFQSNPGYVDDIDLQTDTNIEDVNLLSNDAGISELFRRGADAEYSQGEAALDTALLRNNQDFNVERDGVLNSYKALQNQRNDVLADSRGQAQDLRTETAGLYKDDVRNFGQGLLSSYETNQRAEEKAFDDQLASLEAKRSGDLGSYAQNIIDQMKANDPENALNNYYEAGDGLGDYYTAGMGGDSTQWQDFIDDKEAGQFNNIMGLLGQGGDIRTAGQYAGQSAADNLGGGFDRNTFTDQMSGDAAGRAETARLDAGAAETARVEKEIADQAEADRLAVVEADKAEADRLAKIEADQKRKEIADKNDRRVSKNSGRNEKALSDVTKKGFREIAKYGGW